MSAAEDLRWTAFALNEAFSFASESTAPEVTRKLMLDRWLIMRGAAYPGHARAIADVLCRQAKGMATRLGFGFNDIVSLADTMAVARERHLAVVTESWRAESQVAGDQLDRSRTDTVDLLMTSAKNQLQHAFCILIDNKSNLGGAESQDARRQQTIEAFGMRPGEGGPVASVLVEPPQRAKPFFILPVPLGSTSKDDGAETALLINPHAFTTELHLTVEALLQKNTPNWSVTRAKAVDEHALSLLQTALPGSTAVKNVFIDTPSGREEVDGVITFDDTVIVIEGKGAPLKLAARRGSSDKLLAQLRELVSYGYGQLERDRRHVLEGRPARFLDHRGNCVLEIDGASVRRCYQVMPTLDGLSDLGASIPQLVDLGVLPHGARPWIVGVTDMNVVMDVLTRPAEFLGYLEFRDRWAGERRITTIDELEMLSLFLYQVDLADRLAQADDAQVMHLPHQHLYDSWYAGRGGHGPVVPKPRIKTTKRVRRFVDELTRTRPRGWLASACAAYQLPAAFAHALDEVEHGMASRAGNLGTFMNLNREIAMIVIAEGDSATDIASLTKKARASDGVMLLCLLRQRGRRLELEDVRFVDDS